jgi:O-antigen/teichoic acid export membrane protein
MSTLSQRLFRLDLFALKALGGTASQAGFYSAALNLSIPPAIYSGSISPPLLSTLNRLLSEGDEGKAKEIGLTALRSTIWLIPFAAMTAGTAPEIVSFVFGENYLPASPILSLLIFAALGSLTINVVNAICIAAGKPHWTLRMTGPMVPLALAGHLILIPGLGGMGAAIVTTMVACLTATASILIIHHIWGVFSLFETLLKSTFCSGVAVAGAILWPVEGPMIVLKMMVIISMIIFTFMILGEFTAEEISIVRSLFRRRQA